jgi:hypothetical protein
VVTLETAIEAESQAILHAGLNVTSEIGDNARRGGDSEDSHRFTKCHNVNQRANSIFLRARSRAASELRCVYFEDRR